MKKQTLILTTMLVGGLIFSAVANAGPGKRGDHGDRERPNVEEKVARMTEELGLSDDQAVAALEILTAAEAEREVLREQHEAQVRADMCALKDMVTGQLDAVLTSEQAAQLAEIMESKAAHREEHGERRGKGRGRFSPQDCDQENA